MQIHLHKSFKYEIYFQHKFSFFHCNITDIFDIDNIENVIESEESCF